MSVILLEPSQQSLSRATAPDYSLYTFCCWVSFTTLVEQGNIATFQFDNANMDTMFYQFPENRISVYAAGTGNTLAQLGTITPLTGTMYFLAMVRSSASSLRLYVGTTAENLTETAHNTLNVGARSAAVLTRLGAVNATADFWLNGLIGGARVWSGYAMSLSELQREASSLAPGRLNALWANWPLASDVLDTSGNSRTLTINNGPVKFGASPPDKLVLANLFDETFQGTGYAVMSSTETVGASSTMDPDYLTSNVNSPDGWGTQCLRANTVTPNFIARKDHILSVAQSGTLYFRDEIIIVTENVGNGGDVIILSAWDTGFVLNLFHLELHRSSSADGAVLTLDFNYYDNGGARPRSSLNVVTGTRYSVEILYNTGGTWEYRVNNRTIGAGALTGSIPTNVSYIVVGANVFDGTHPAQILHGNVGLGNLGFLGPTNAGSFLSSGDRVRETTTTTGTGNVTLAGAVAGFVLFSSIPGVQGTNQLAYAIVGTTEWEVGIGSWHAGNILHRDLVLASSNAGALVNFSAGTKDVFNDFPAQAGTLAVASQVQAGSGLLPSSCGSVVIDEFEVDVLELGTDAVLEIR